ncbi:MAG: PC4/YdbC family ssDNA-binding protein [Peptostreptococcaceae bacterium]|nr:PC4/YdbC family ssDNA-binding protein [Peptostreptococcaceae bacterium]MDY5738480.1 PC4/YdbC family ssDNA-binding protein [Anaerovoracaceae bacterium]SFE62705.1 hypothetical protein SAMN02910327_01659 [Peptostreptococcaceae bacterium pGA-8]
MEKITFEIRKHLGVLKEQKNGWRKELNLVSWNDAPPKYDIRDWDETHEKCSRGITLFDDEMKTLVNLVTEYSENLD